MAEIRISAAEILIAVAEMGFSDAEVIVSDVAEPTSSRGSPAVNDRSWQARCVSAYREIERPVFRADAEVVYRPLGASMAIYFALVSILCVLGGVGLVYEAGSRNFLCFRARSKAECVVWRDYGPFTVRTVISLSQVVRVVDVPVRWAGWIPATAVGVETRNGETHAIGMVHDRHRDADIRFEHGRLATFFQDGRTPDLSGGRAEDSNGYFVALLLFALVGAGVAFALQRTTLRFDLERRMLAIQRRRWPLAKLDTMMSFDDLKGARLGDPWRGQPYSSAVVLERADGSVVPLVFGGSVGHTRTTALALADTVNRHLGTFREKPKTLLEAVTTPLR